MERDVEQSVTFTSQRTFGSTFVRAAQIWFSRPSGYVSTLVIIGIFTFALHGTGPLWLAALGGFAWIALMLPFLFAMQSWTTVRAARRTGLPLFKFDSKGMSCNSGQLQMSTPWTGINQMRLTRRSCFVYVTPRAAWFFGRNELSAEDEAQLLGFARASNVKLLGE